jgi:hypothetical protein
MTSQSSIVKKTSTLPNQMIHIMFKCVVHLHGHRNKVMPFMKPSIFVNFNNETKFRWLTNDIQSHVAQAMVDSNKNALTFSLVC